MKAAGFFASPDLAAKRRRVAFAFHAAVSQQVPRNGSDAFLLFGFREI
ncbi:MAG TPA: hypothetical protein VG891_09640 [Rhizomicrobium sp.]|nr:hypothetical protein [Rhizomicrobium sp.]